MPGLDVSDVVYEQRSHEDQREDATYTFESLHPHIFDVQPILLVKATGVFDLWPVTSLGVYCLGICGIVDGGVCEQDKYMPGRMGERQ